MRAPDDETIGRRIRHYRGQRPQQSVALSMRVLGFPTWRQQTLDLLERGQRTLKLREAVVLASILGCSLDQLVEED